MQNKDTFDQVFIGKALGAWSFHKHTMRDNIKHFIYASSSSVYGDSKRSINLESDNTDRPESFYAASKKSKELIKDHMKQYIL